MLLLAPLVVGCIAGEQGYSALGIDAGTQQCFIGCYIKLPCSKELPTENKLSEEPPALHPNLCSPWALFSIPGVALIPTSCFSFCPTALLLEKSGNLFEINVFL